MRLPRIPLLRPLCRISFVVFGVLPLAFTFGAVIWRQHTMDVEHYETVCAGQLGLALNVVNVAHPEPGVTWLEHVGLLEPETSEPVARCPRVELRRRETAVGVSAELATIRLGKADRLWRLLHDRLLRQRHLLDRPVYIVIDRVDFAGDEGLVLEDVRADRKRTENGTEARLRWHFPAKPTAGVEVVLSRDQQSSKPWTSIMLKSPDRPMPAILFADGINDIARQVRDVSFQGYLSADLSPSGWQAETSGHLSGLELSRFMHPDIPHTLSGPASVTLRSLQMQNGQITELDFDLTAGPGQISASLLRSAAEHLGMDSVPDAERADTTLSYTELGVAVYLNREGLAIQGKCSAGTVGTVMILADGSEVHQPASQILPIGAVLQMLVPDETFRFPATQHTKPLLQILPLPTISREP